MHLGSPTQRRTFPLRVSRAHRAWIRAPRTITPATRAALVERLERHARARWSKHCLQVIVRVRGQFAYVDAVPVGDTDRTAHLCRLRATLDPERWELALFDAERGAYALSRGPHDDFHVTPEQALDAGARVLASDA